MQTSLSTELRGVIESRLRASSPRQVLAIASALCAQELVETTPTAPIVHDLRARFTVDGNIVQDAATSLVWTREKTLAGGCRNWANAQKAASECRIGGFTDWRLPTIKELLSIVDYERAESPTIDPSFQCEPSWYWTSTPVASSPSACAWSVSFSVGDSVWSYQGFEGFVRAVRPGKI
jgi:hypothetical protein